MRINKILLAPLLAITTLCCTTSCGEDRWKEYSERIELDSWLDSLMRQDYYWYADMPSPNKVNLFAAPDVYLKTVLNTADKSFTLLDSLRQTAAPSYGLDYTLYRVVRNDTAYNALITYIVPHSPADKAGLKRGEWIMQLNDTLITKKTENRLALLIPQKLLIGTHTVGTDELGEVYDTVEPHRTLTIGAAEPPTDNPIAYHRVINRAGFKVGYVLYNQFSSGTLTNSQEYNNELRTISQEFKAAGIQTCVVDLRYNTGSDMASVQLLATLLAPATLLGQPMAYLEYNDKNTSRSTQLDFDTNLLQAGANLNLPRLYILTSSRTSGGAEMLINSLNGNMDLIMIGATTKGQLYATERYYNPKHRWAINLAVCKVLNAKQEADYTGGFVPTYPTSELANLATVLPFGDENEALLSIALSHLDGTYPATTQRTIRPLGY